MPTVWTSGGRRCCAPIFWTARTLSAFWRNAARARICLKTNRLARLDTYLCDVKDLQIRDGLHVFGRIPEAGRRTMLLSALQKNVPPALAADLEARLDGCARSERQALLDTLDGRFVEPGPAGAPTRGRGDVLPTGRNMFTIDRARCRLIPPWFFARRTADELVRRHLQEKGDWPRSLMIDLWGSATMRTGGEDLALALVLVGAEPVWSVGSTRVTGFEILPVAMLGRPRVDVTLRISGLFRDAFEARSPCSTRWCGRSAGGRNRARTPARGYRRKSRRRGFPQGYGPHLRSRARRIRRGRVGADRNRRLVRARRSG